jgi:hypothetical protein
VPAADEQPHNIPDFEVPHGRERASWRLGILDKQADTKAEGSLTKRNKELQQLKQSYDDHVTLE